MISIQEIIDKESILSKAGEITHELISVSSNYIYRVNADGTDYIVRIDGEQKDYLDLDRNLEVLAMKKAADIGLSPRVLSSDDERYIVMECVTGGYIDKKQMFEDAYIKKMVDALKKVHQISGVNRECSPFYMLDKYMAGINSLNVTIPDEFSELMKKVPAIGKGYSQNATYTTKYCHNDFFTFNMIDQPDHIVVIDWELSGVSSVFFDLSTISFSAMYGDSEDKLMLERYFGNYEDEYKILLEDMKYMNMLRDVGWLLLHSGMSGENVESYVNPILKAIERGHLHFRCNCT